MLIHRDQQQNITIHINIKKIKERSKKGQRKINVTKHHCTYQQQDNQRKIKDNEGQTKKDQRKIKER